MKPKMFNIRVYGLVIRQGKVLLTDEIRFGIPMTKFPGGGLKPGEGTVDCLRREMREEMGVEISNVSHFYTTDFFQIARFTEPPQQLLNIYYTCTLEGIPDVVLTSQPFDFEKKQEGAQVFRWEKIDMLACEDLTLPIDKVVLKKLQHLTG